MELYIRNSISLKAGREGEPEESVWLRKTTGGLLITCGAALETSRCKRAVAFVLCPSICSSLLARPEPLCSVLLVTLETRQCSHRQVYHILSLDGIHPNRWQVGKLY